jgi:hypothetical protein
MTIDAQKKVEFSLAMTQQEFANFVHACDQLISLTLTDKDGLNAVSVVQGVKNSMLLALND